MYKHRGVLLHHQYAGLLLVVTSASVLSRLREAEAEVEY